MKAHDFLYVIFTALILAYPLYEKLLIKEEYRTKVLYYGYPNLLDNISMVLYAKEVAPGQAGFMKP